MGLRLDPLCVGHLFILADLGSPLVVETGEPITATDIALAALVCAQSPSESKRDLRRWWFRWFAGLVGILSIRRDLQSECNAFSEYMRESTDHPQIKRTRSIFTAAQEDESDSVVPMHWQLLVLLMTHFGMSWRDAMNFPVREAQLLWLTKRDLEHGVNFWGGADEAFERACREADAAMERN